jgi:hypothetical protein
VNELWGVDLIVTEHNAQIARDFAAIRRASRAERGRRSGLPARVAAILRDFADRLDSEPAPEHPLHRLANS